MDLLGLSEARYQQLFDQAKALGGDPGTVFWTLASRDQMARVISYGVPHRFNHWSFGKRYLEVLQSPGRLYEFVVWNPTGSEAYIDATLDTDEVEMIAAHVLGHSTVFGQNRWFRRDLALERLSWMTHAEWVDTRTEDLAEEVLQYAHLFHQRTGSATRVKVLRHTKEALDLEILPDPGLLQVYAPLDLLLGLEDATHPPWFRDPVVPSPPSDAHQESASMFWRIWRGENVEIASEQVEDAALKAMGRSAWSMVDVVDVLGSTARSPLVREAVQWLRTEWDYFWALKSTKLLNEGWATYIHQHLTASPSSEKAAWVQSHLRSGVERQEATNPYWLGSALFQLLEEDGEDPAEWMERSDDHLFLTMAMTPERVRKLQLFPIEVTPNFGLHDSYWAIFHDHVAVEEVGMRLADWWQAIIHGGIGTPQITWTDPRHIQVSSLWGQSLYGTKPPPASLDLWWFIGVATLLGRSIEVTLEGSFLQAKLTDQLKTLTAK